MSKTLCIFALFVGAFAFNTKDLSNPDSGNLRKAQQVQVTTDEATTDQDNNDEESGDVVEGDDTETVETVDQPEVAQGTDTVEAADKPEAAVSQSVPKSAPAEQVEVTTEKPAAPVSMNVRGVKAVGAGGKKQGKASPEELEAAKARVQDAKADLDAFNNDDGFENDNAQLQKTLANETESASLASMLGKIRSEIRQYAGKASYGPQLEARLEKAEQHVKDLEAEIARKKQEAEEKAKKESEAEEEEDKDISGANGPETVEEWKQEVTNKQHAFSTLLLLLTVTQVGIFAMLSGSNNQLKKNTWTVVNTMAVVIIASTLFHVISVMFEEFVEITHMQVFMHVLYALVIFSIALFGSYKLRNDTIACTAFKAVIFWIVLLAKSGAISTAQKKLGDGPNHATAINFSCLGVLVVIVLLSHFVKNKFFDDKDKNWYDDVEVSLCGGAFGGGIAFLAHIWLDHHFPPGEEHSEEAHANIVAKDLYALIACVLAVLLTTPMQNMINKATDEGKYWYSRALTFLNATIGIMPYFAVSLGTGSWISHQMRFRDGSTGADLISTGVSTFWGLVMILAVSFIRVLRRQAEASDFTLAKLMLGFGGYIAGYAWGGLISTSIAKLNHGWGWSEAQHHMFTIICGLFLNGLAIPVYYYYLAPAVSKAQLLKDDLS